VHITHPQFEDADELSDEVEEQGLAGAEIDNIQESGIWRNEKYVMSCSLLRNIEKY